MNYYDRAAEKIKRAEKCKPICVGVVGPTGPQGIQGPTGPAGEAAVLGGVQYQFITEGYPLIGTNEPIVFNTSIVQNSPDITYNSSTGEFIFSKNKSYFVTWWAVIDGTEGTAQITFSFTNGVNSVISSSPLVTGQINGSALIVVDDAPETYTLRNTSASTVGLSTMPVHASITIVELK